MLRDNVTSMTETNERDGDTYEMFWDCKFCRTPKLLGLSHRHCPVCGAPQNAEQRYFPNDDEKVRVADHVYMGRDLVCHHCGTYNSRNSQHCRECGAPTTDAKDASVLPDQPQGGANVPQPLAGRAGKRAAPKRSRWPWLIGAMVLLGIVGIATFFLWKRDATFEVTGHDWERSIAIERFGPVKDTAWCDQVPPSGQVLRRYRAVRSHEQVPDGETCTTRKVDQGDGTFREVKDCKPKYKSRPVEDNRCDYQENRWSTARSVAARGQSLARTPEWPALPPLSACSNVGCERAGPKRETYRVELRGPEGTQTCEVDQSRWAAMRVGARVNGQVRVMSGGLDCDSLTAL